MDLLSRTIKHEPKPTLLKPFSDNVFEDIQKHVSEIRRIFDWPGIPYHDDEFPEESKFNRWYWNNLPLLKSIHYDSSFVELASELAQIKLKPSYCFLSMYGSDGVCPLHVDRPSCQFTIDLQVNSDGTWPIYIEDTPYVLENGKAIFYSGTGQEHYRKPMGIDATCTYMDLAFFHFVPTTWQGDID